MKKFSLLTLIEISLCAAFAFVLDLLPSIKLSSAISVSFAMVPIFILAFRWGVRASFVGGLLWGLLQIVLGDAADDILTPVQGFIEFFIAFSFIGLAGLFRSFIQANIHEGNKGKTIFLVVVATFIGSIGRYFWHFLAGMIFWGKFAPEGQSPFLYSLIANGTTMLLSGLLCAIILSIIITMSPRLVKRFA
ncbi:MULTISPECIES: energy-coupled thiamine transporter ThiT [Heyndrickxia]|jgi:thiamine transporter|uniref:Energy-coupled thiamine transporter ThiT n=1 Tax=Heyndrickxia oleronia TaxID=38875 RepID=A0A8E2I5B6_9BACI|nr:energy-coupled thiamine transporter ThiT [Heyndrickxia oleronia]NYV65490.1 energy-coupled thiamine transporter ThiT [Bacillus sp. Gen3]OJH20575.1 energy-coupled thiamine transporter ThiT [Bacillus obstructivus]MBU5210140.1 energy-coupled thiamine transporter ThiT [Heyndrickxia oleronia]MCI1592709.1 energy-coupled thiamine transporter ThiT [Heyndrickxia oleronia]MCI1614208.1 energy-coupled thiamine transporter ThiT [Heyndrickxia oleronia]